MAEEDNTTYYVNRVLEQRLTMLEIEKHRIEQVDIYKPNDEIQSAIKRIDEEIECLTKFRNKYLL